MYRFIIYLPKITRKDMTQSVISFDSIMKMLLQLLFYKAEKCFLKNAPPSSVLTAPHLMAQIKKASFLFKCSNVIICSSLYLVLVFAIHSHGGHLGHVSWTIYINFRSTFLRMRHMKFGFDWPSGFLEEDEKCERRQRRRRRRRTTEHGYTTLKKVMRGRLLFFLLVRKIKYDQLKFMII